MIVCKFCHKESKHNYKGLCQQCYTYFYKYKYDAFEPSKYGSLSRVTDKHSKQYGMPICHICGRAYTKLQQHIYYSHNMYRNEYCDKFGIDRSINMTTEKYHNKMREYAYKYNMDEQLIRTGVYTRFKPGHNIKYKRSPMTMKRLREIGKSTIHKNRVKGKQ